MDSLATLENNVRALIARCAELEATNKALLTTNDEQRQELVRSHSEINALQQELRQLRTAHTLTATPENREKAKQQISALIARVDQAIDVLKHPQSTIHNPPSTIHNPQ